MDKSYRLLAIFTLLAAVCASFGLGSYLTALNYPDEQRHQPYRYAPDKPLEVSDTGSAPTQAFEYREPCKNPKGNYESDLCAQWRAAKAAEESALWTKYGVWVGMAGMIGLFWTLYYTREAVKDTGDATKAMVRQNEIAEAAQRPWVGVEIVNVSMSSSKDALELTVDIFLRNRGKMPALAIKSWARIISGHGEQTKEGDFFPEGEYTRIVHNLMPGSSGHNSLHPRVPVDRIAMTAVFVDGKLAVGPQVVPRLEIKIEYEWGEPIQKGRTIQVFSISVVDEIYHKRDERLSIPIVLGTVPIPPLKAIELASPKIS